MYVSQPLVPGLCTTIVGSNLTVLTSFVLCLYRRFIIMELFFHSVPKELVIHNLQ